MAITASMVKELLENADKDAKKKPKVEAAKK